MGKYISNLFTLLVLMISISLDVCASDVIVAKKLEEKICGSDFKNSEAQSCISEVDTIGDKISRILAATSLKLLDEIRFNVDDLSMTGKVPSTTDLALSSQCKKNRPSYWDPKITFGVCQNGSKLNMYMNKSPGDRGTVDTWFFVDVDYDIITQSDKICIVDHGWFTTPTIGCVYTKEPYPDSRYTTFFNPKHQVTEKNGDNKDTVHNTGQDLLVCSNMGSCYDIAKRNSKTLQPISSPLIQCINSMLSKLIVAPSVCSIDQTGAVDRNESMLYKFQTLMKKGVTALLTLYIIFFGFRIILDNKPPPQSEFIIFIIKFLLVVYFSIGLTSSIDGNRFDGIIDWVFPILLQGATTLASWFMNASTNGLCEFKPEYYSPGFEHIALWDSLDCRVMHYLGVDGFKTHSIPPYLLLLIPSLVLGMIPLAQASIAYPLIVISLAAYMINTFIVCLILVTLLGIFAPIFVPMALFSYTKGIFDSWAKLMISFVLQPMAVAAFMILMFSIYDSTFYDSCQYQTFTLDNKGESALFDKSDTNLQDKRLFFKIRIPHDVNDLSYKKCQSSLGFMISKLSFGSLSLQKLKEICVSLITCIVILYLMYNFSAQLAGFTADIAGSISVGNMGIGTQTLFKSGMSKVVAPATRLLSQRARLRRLWQKKSGDTASSGATKRSSTAPDNLPHQSSGSLSDKLQDQDKEE